jgi:hypothetical protein
LTIRPFTKLLVDIFLYTVFTTDFYTYTYVLNETNSTNKTNVYSKKIMIARTNINAIEMINYEKGRKKALTLLLFMRRENYFLMSKNRSAQILTIYLEDSDR